MDNIKKALLGIEAGLIMVVVLLVIVLQFKALLLKPQVASTPLGNVGSRGIRLYSSTSASTSPTFLGLGANVFATTTLLTVGCDPTNTNVVSSPNNLQDIDTVGVFVQITSTTTGAQNVYVQPQVSNDCVDWYASSLPDQVTTAGAAVANITLPSASSTIVQISPAQKGTTLHQFVLRNLAARAIRFQTWVSVATSSVWMQAAAVERITR